MFGHTAYGQAYGLLQAGMIKARGSFYVYRYIHRSMPTANAEGAEGYSVVEVSLMATPSDRSGRSVGYRSSNIASPKPRRCVACALPHVAPECERESRLHCTNRHSRNWSSLSTRGLSSAFAVGMGRKKNGPAARAEFLLLLFGQSYHVYTRGTWTGFEKTVINRSDTGKPKNLNIGLLIYMCVDTALQRPSCCTHAYTHVYIHA